MKQNLPLGSPPSLLPLQIWTNLQRLCNVFLNQERLEGYPSLFVKHKLRMAANFQSKKSGISRLLVS